jgi:ABC-type branched-subunit amino acid transport system ATPase component
MTTELLRAAQLSGGYGKVACVRELNLEVRPGEVVVLLGPNGAGKTTTLMTLSGALPALGGKIFWKGSEVNHPKPHTMAKSGMALVPGERSIIGRLSTRDNLRLGIGPVEKAVEHFPELGPLLKRRAGLLSGGEQRMLALGRSLAMDPVMLMADELSLGLAPLIVRRLLGVLRQAADEGAGVLLVEQRAREALAIADRACVLRRGSILFEGPAAEVAKNLGRLESAYFDGLEQPADALAAQGNGQRS